MDIKKVGKIPASRVSIAACALGTSTILLCYSIAVGLGHVPAWLPMISDCAVNAPERYPFRIGMILSASLVFANAILYYFYIDSKITRNFADKLALVLAGVASLGLATLAAVNEAEDNNVHSGASVIFFFGYEIFMIITSVRLAQCPSCSRTSIWVKRIIALCAGLLLALFIHFSIKWGQHRLGIALCEWSTVMLILIYNGTMSWEFQNEFVAELLFANPSSSTVSSASLLSPSSSTLSSIPPPAAYMYPSNEQFVPYYHPQHMQQVYIPLPMVAEYRDN